jgi:hypothetical protein
MLRVGACADELRLMRGEDSCLAGAATAGEASASSTRKASSACAPPFMERMWKEPCGNRAQLSKRWPEEGAPVCPVEALRRDEGL